MKERTAKIQLFCAMPVVWTYTLRIVEDQACFGEETEYLSVLPYNGGSFTTIPFNFKVLNF